MMMVRLMNSSTPEMMPPVRSSATPDALARSLLLAPKVTWQHTCVCVCVFVVCAAAERHDSSWQEQFGCSRVLAGVQYFTYWLS